MKVGLIVNPLAGIGGPAGLKGSDADTTVAIAKSRGVTSKISQRLDPVLQVLADSSIHCITAAGSLGGDWCKAKNLQHELVGIEVPDVTSADHTRTAARAITEHSPDLLVFVGGDGTARDVLDAVGDSQTVLGVPAGVKMHSGVFANNPSAAAEVIRQMSLGELVTVGLAEVRDIDEEAFKQGVVKAAYYGEMWVPEALRYIQQVKSGGVEVEALAVNEIVAEVVSQLDDQTTYIVGSGSTTAAVMEHLAVPNTLLGVDVIRNGELVLADAYESQLFELVQKEHCKVLLTVIGGQGHLLGRGNQQLSARVIKAIGKDNLMVIATKTKLESLPDGIVVDSGDSDLDQELCGFIRVITGFEDAVLCPVRA